MLSGLAPMLPLPFMQNTAKKPRNSQRAVVPRRNEAPAGAAVWISALLAAGNQLAPAERNEIEKRHIRRKRSSLDGKKLEWLAVSPG